MHRLLKPHLRPFIQQIQQRGAWKKKPELPKSCWDGVLVPKLKPTPIVEEDDGSLGVCVLEKPKVIIVGAGMAGLTVGQRLARAGLDNFMIVEASGRVGGRIDSAWSGESVIEAGAEWIEGDWNPALRLAALEELKPCCPTSPIVHLASDGRPIDPVTVANAASLFNCIRKKAVALFGMDMPPDGPLTWFFKEKLNERGPLAGDMKNLVHSFTEKLAVRHGTTPDQLSMRFYGSRLESDIQVRMSQGLSGVLAPLIREIPTGNIKLCKTVKTICWSCPKVKVIYDDGSLDECHFCVLTMSLGVLKCVCCEMFNPPLPKDKLSSIDCIGYGCINKVFAEYKEPFWLKNEGCLHLAQEACPDDLWTSHVYKIEEVCQGNKTLSLLVAGQPAVDLECIKESDIAQQLTALLRKFTGVKTLPYPIGICRTKWRGNPLFRGAVSYLANGSTLSQQCNLAIPLPGPNDPQPPRLLFAGEATALGYFGTIQGARMSGLREAERIIAITRRYGGPPRPYEPPVKVTTVHC